MGLVVVAYSSLSGKGRGGRLFEAGRLLTFSASRMGAYSRWALIRINRVVPFLILIMSNLDLFIFLHVI